MCEAAVETGVGAPDHRPVACDAGVGAPLASSPLSLANAPEPGRRDDMEMSGPCCSDPASPIDTSVDDPYSRASATSLPSSSAILDLEVGNVAAGQVAMHRFPTPSQPHPTPPLHLNRSDKTLVEGRDRARALASMRSLQMYTRACMCRLGEPTSKKHPSCLKQLEFLPDRDPKP
jgi:hypothetical protein